MASQYAELEKYIGSKAVAEDVITATQLHRLNMTLNRHDPLPKEGDPVPWGWHSIFFPRLIPNDKMSLDGLSSDFEGCPSPLPRSMFAGNDLKFYEPLRVGDRATKEISIESVAPKEGRSGKLVFVTYGVRVIGPRGLVLEDDQRIVFRDEQPAGVKPVRPPGDRVHIGAPWMRTVTADPVMLFRFSACTFNPHRIHYDHRYATQVENYPDLVVHGGLTAVLLLELVRDYWTENAFRMTGYSMRAKAPLFANRPITLLGEPASDGMSCRLWAADEVGNIAMEISPTFA